MKRKNKNISGKMISGFGNNAPANKADAKYISENIPGENEEEKLADEINDIINESRENDIGKITGEWVREWDEKKQNGVIRDAKSEERKEFITNSLVEAESDFERNALILNKRSPKKKIWAWVAFPAAAAIVGAFFLVKLLLPSYNPDKLFAKYYEPLSAISPVTRSADETATNSYASAIESYKNKNYQAAAAGFSDAILKDPQNISPRFFLGVSQMALGNYEQAENILENVIESQGEYVKEARWYLGLAYIKTGNPEKARECFKILAKSPGFYSDRAEKILRRLR